jgi:hypothetical protein
MLKIKSLPVLAVGFGLSGVLGFGAAGCGTQPQEYPVKSTTTAIINASVAGQTCHYVNDTDTEGTAPVEAPPGSGMLVSKNYKVDLHAEGDLQRPAGSNYPADSLEGEWTGVLYVSGTVEIDGQTQTVDPNDPANQKQFAIKFDANGVPESVAPIGNVPAGGDDGFEIKDFATPGDQKQASINGNGTTGTVTLTCLEASFSTASMRYGLKLEVDATLVK